MPSVKPPSVNGVATNSVSAAKAGGKNEGGTRCQRVVGYESLMVKLTPR